MTRLLRKAWNRVSPRSSRPTDSWGALKGHGFSRAASTKKTASPSGAEGGCFVVQQWISRFFANLSSRSALRIAATLVACAAFAAADAHPHFDHVPLRDHARVNPLAVDPHAIPAGRQLYLDHCAQCHKSDARGDGRKKPSLLTESVRNATDGDLEWFLRQGDLRHGMPSWSSLPEAQRWQIIAYLRTLK